MLIMPSFQKSLIVEQFQDNYLKRKTVKEKCCQFKIYNF